MQHQRLKQQKLNFLLGRFLELAECEFSNQPTVKFLRLFPIRILLSESLVKFVEDLMLRL